MRRDWLPDMCEYDGHLMTGKNALRDQVRRAEPTIVKRVEIRGDVTRFLRLHAQSRHRRTRAQRLGRKNPPHECLAFVAERSRDERPLYERVERRTNTSLRTRDAGNVVTVAATVVDDE